VEFNATRPALDKYHDTYHAEQEEGAQRPEEPLKSELASGLVVLLCGPSGTGKTMTVNAVAHHLQKRVLLVDLPSLQSGGSQKGSSGEGGLKALFREAEISNAVLFFDECESIFQQRSGGSSGLLNHLLIEIELYTGIVFLATNRQFDLDEAMYRRITSVFEFKSPDLIQRKKIWEVTMRRFVPTGVVVSGGDSIDWDSIALRYEFSGGFIRNAVGAATRRAVGRTYRATKKGLGAVAGAGLGVATGAAGIPGAGGAGVAGDAAGEGAAGGGAVVPPPPPPTTAEDSTSTVPSSLTTESAPTITQEDLMEGCKEQMRGSLQMKTFEHRVVPTAGLDALVMPSVQSAALHEVVGAERARAVLYGQWGLQQQRGTAVLFVGMPGQFYLLINSLVIPLGQLYLLIPLQFYLLIPLGQFYLLIPLPLSYFLLDCLSWLSYCQAWARKQWRKR
jgi:SpoVK/Ycf46/Vps4 family AAA+-type ATPase